VSIKVIEVFVNMREMLTNNQGLRFDIELIKRKIEDQDRNIELVFSYLDELMEKTENPKPRNPVGFKRQEER